MRSQAVVAVALVSGAAFAGSQDRTVSTFDAVHIASGLRATVTIGPLRAVHLEGDPATLELIEAVVEDGRLRVGLKPDARWPGDSREVRVTLQTPQLRDVSASGGSIVRAELTRADKSALHASGGSELHLRGLDAADVAVHGSGGAIIDVAGRAQSVALNLSGGSRLEGRDFSARDLLVRGSGGSVARLGASGGVSGSLSGGSQLFVRGASSTRVATSGGSQVERED